MDKTQKQPTEITKIVDKIKQASNVLVAVNSNPSVDELSAALAITLAINGADKHATAVFSGDIPPAIQFLNPEKTFENTVDSLRDFIIALDKEKADHIRYKVVDDVVKIFVTPYRTTIDETDLDFSQGDYNVEFVIAVGVQSEADLDRALESHGRIFHDATVASISLGEPTAFGGINWAVSDSSSYSETVTPLVDGLKKGKQIDAQIATALLTGVVAATDRFRNDQTRPGTMSVAAKLMESGADQQLVAENVEIGSSEEPESAEPDTEQDESSIDVKNTLPEKSDPTPPSQDDSSAEADDGSLSIPRTPEGDVDQVAEQVAGDNSAEALAHAQSILGSEEAVNESPAPATEADSPAEPAGQDEQQFAEQLAEVTAPAAPAVPAAQEVPTTPVAPTPQILEQEQQAPEPPQPALPDPPVSEPAVSRSGDAIGEPLLGGTLNATTSQAAEDKRLEIEADRNRTILSHGEAGDYLTDEPTKQAPINAFSGGAQPVESGIPDVMAAPAAQTQTNPASAQFAVDAALGTDPFAQANTPNPIANQPAGQRVIQPLEGGSSELPLPMPDFSNLPPIPGDQPAPSAGSVGDMLMSGSEVGGDVIAPADPTQFKIPGQ